MLDRSKIATARQLVSQSPVTPSSASPDGRDGLHDLAAVQFWLARASKIPGLALSSAPALACDPTSLLRRAGSLPPSALRRICPIQLPQCTSLFSRTDIPVCPEFGYPSCRTRSDFPVSVWTNLTPDRLLQTIVPSLITEFLGTMIMPSRMK